MDSTTRSNKPKTNKPYRNGKLLEQLVQHVYENKGYKVLTYKQYMMDREEYEGQKLLILNAPYQTIFKRQGKSEFLVIDPSKEKPTRIECKWQQVGGSVDEKLPYIIENVKGMKEDSIILVDGGAQREGSIDWLRQQAKEIENLTVFSLTEFIAFANKEL